MTQLLFNRPAWIAAFGLLLSSSVFAQSDGMVWGHYGSYNPAVSGVRYRQDASIQLTNPFTKYSGYNFNYDARVKVLHGGVGVSYYRGQYPGAELNKLNLNYSYHIRTGENALLALGASAGFFHLRQRDASYWHLPINDMVFTMGLGAHFQYKNLNAGASVQMLNQPLFDFATTKERLKPQYSFYLDYDWKVSKNLTLQPSILLGSSNFQYTTGNIALRATIKDRFWFGAAIGNSTSVMVGYNFKNNMSIGYTVSTNSFDWKNANINHGLTLRYRLK